MLQRQEIPKYDFRRTAKNLGQTIEIKTCVIQSNQINYSAIFSFSNKSNF